MALFQRTTSTDSVQRWRPSLVEETDGRKTSLTAVDEEGLLPSSWSRPQNSPSAFEVSKTQRLLQVSVAVLYCLLSAGIVFGFAAIKPILVDQGVYRDRCTSQELENGVWICYEQEIRLNLMFTVAAVSTNVCALPVGTVLDRYGPRIASFVGVLFLTLGSLALAFAKDLSFDAYVPGYLFLALGGPFVFISSFQLSNAFPKRSGLILALLTGAFDTSSAVFLIYRLVYQYTNRAVTTKAFFLVYLIVPALILLAQIFVMPARTYKTMDEVLQDVEDPSDDIHDSDTDIEDDSRRTELQATRREHRESVASELTALLDHQSNRQHQENGTHGGNTETPQPSVWTALHIHTATEQILSPWFLLVTLFTIIQMLRINYFIATIRTEYAYLLHSPELAQHLNEIFDVALPLGGIVAVPFIGLLLDNASLPLILALLITLATVIGILGVIANIGAAYATIALFVLYRPFFYTAISDYAAKIFGFRTFGRVYGVIICLAGMGNFAQPGLDVVTHAVFRGNPVPVGLALTALAALAGGALVGFIWERSWGLRRERLEEEAEDADEALIPASIAVEDGAGDDRHEEARVGI